MNKVFTAFLLPLHVLILCSCRCRLQGYAFYFALVAPLSLLLLCNLVVFGTLAWSMSTVKTVATRSVKNSRKMRLRSYVGLTTLLGLTWTSGLLLLVTSHVAVQWIFTLLVSTQGFFIFILQIATHRLVKRHISSRSTKRKIGPQSSTPSTWSLFRLTRISMRRNTKRHSASSIESRSAEFQKARRIYLERLNSDASATPAGSSKYQSNMTTTTALESRQSATSISSVKPPLNRTLSHVSALFSQSNTIKEVVIGRQDIEVPSSNADDSRLGSMMGGSQDHSGVVIISPRSETSYAILRQTSSLVSTPTRPSTLNIQSVNRSDKSSPEFQVPPPIVGEHQGDVRDPASIIYSEVDFSRDTPNRIAVDVDAIVHSSGRVLESSASLEDDRDAGYSEAPRERPIRRYSLETTV